MPVRAPIPTTRTLPLPLSKEVARALQTLGLATLLSAAALVPRAHAAGGHGHDEAPAKAEKADKGDKAEKAEKAEKGEKGEKVAAKIGKPPAGPDPMDTLREKLAEKLGAAPAPKAKSPYVVRVTAQESPTKPAPAAHAGHDAPVAAAPQPAAKLAAAYRATKPAEGHGAAGGHDIHWDYSGEGAPDKWGQLKPEFAACSSGKRQSPIDIRDGVRVDLEPVQFSYQPSAFRVVDNGHTIQVNLAQGNSIEVGGNRYELVQFHFHRPSEERINGRQFDMVAHLVHKDLDGKLAVVAVLLDRGSVHPLVQTVWNHLPLEKGMDVPSTRATLDMTQLLPADRRYYTYMGSLTTPPCSEGVLWMVMAQPVTISPEQIGVFARLYPMNARPIQQAAGRLIKQSQ